MSVSPDPVVVIGAGAAGMMAAIAAADRLGTTRRVVLLEKNRKTGVKILMSGGTRCNLTHHASATEIVSAFGHASRFLQRSVGKFDPAAVVRWFGDRGVGTKIESTGKVFPESNSAVDVRDALLDQCRASGVDIRTGVSVGNLRPIDAIDGGTRWEVDYEDTDAAERDNVDRRGGAKRRIDAAAVIVTAGGKSWAKCGTTGDAYGWLSTLGHGIVPPRPALVPIVGGHDWTRALSGLTLPDVSVSVVATPGIDRGRWPPVRRDVGDGPAKLPRGVLARRRSSWLWTHFGYSGPAAMDVSGTVTAANSPADLRLELDLAPEIGADAVDRALRSYPGGSRVTGWVSTMVPSRLATSLVAGTATGGEPEDVAASQLTAKRRARLVDAVKRLSLPIGGTRGFDKAEVTAGGVRLSEVDPGTMASRRCPGLYIAGEVLDVDGPIGGYNFQAAFATGRAAGLAAAAAVMS